MLEKEFCTTPTIHEYEFAHYRHRLHGTAADEDGSSTEPKHGPQLVDLRDRALPLGLERPPPACGTEHQDQGGRSHQAAFATEGKASAAVGQDRRPRHDTDSEEPLDSAFRATGPAGRISPAGVVIEPYYLGDSVTQISPTTYSFSRRRRTVLGAPLSEADLTAVARRSSSTTTFSEEDFQISYHKVLDSSAASWLGEGEDDDEFGTARSRYRQRRDAGSVPSVELPSIRATHKSQSEQLASRGSGVEDVAVQRPRSEDLSVHVRETPRATLGHLEASIVRGALKRIYQPSRTDSDTDRHVGFGSSPAGLPQTTQSSVKPCSEDCGPEAAPSPPPPSDLPPVTPPPPRMPPVEKPPRGNHHHQTSAGQGVPRSPPAVKLVEPERPSEEKREWGSPTPSGLPQGKEAATSRSRSRSPKVTRMSSFLQARNVRRGRPLGSGRKTSSPRRSIATDDDDDDEITAAEYRLAVVSTKRATPVVAGSVRSQVDKAVQVHIRTLDKRLVACSILAGVLAVALVAVVLFALLDSHARLGSAPNSGQEIHDITRRNTE
ncbi:uncharacterized protein [Dermacentor albipictus]|uniref:uncharacterized protein isoform X2 n=1 Tax=Dermacentor albipictus TaxID=60249 RepID=UPI0031FCF510